MYIHVGITYRGHRVSVDLFDHKGKDINISLNLPLDSMKLINSARENSDLTSKDFNSSDARAVTFSTVFLQECTIPSMRIEAWNRRQL